MVDQTMRQTLCIRILSILNQVLSTSLSNLLTRVILLQSIHNQHQATAGLL